MVGVLEAEESMSQAKPMGIVNARRLQAWRPM